MYYIYLFKSDHQWVQCLYVVADRCDTG